LHGGTYDLIIVDEVWNVTEEVYFDALRPSQIAVKSPLLSSWSTSGDEGSKDYAASSGAGTWGRLTNINRHGFILPNGHCLMLTRMTIRTGDGQTQPWAKPSPLTLFMQLQNHLIVQRSFVPT
jgi:hypothetical protein